MESLRSHFKTFGCSPYWGSLFPIPRLASRVASWKQRSPSSTFPCTVHSHTQHLCMQHRSLENLSASPQSPCTVQMLFGPYPILNAGHAADKPALMDHQYQHSTTLQSTAQCSREPCSALRAA